MLALIRTTLVVSLFNIGALPLQAQLTLPDILSDHMVLQRDKPVRIWGTAPPDQSVTITFADQRLTARANADGHWSTFLEPMPASTEAHTLTVRAADESYTISDVLIGEVWLCSGQSNMEWSINASDRVDEFKSGATDTSIRAFKIPHVSEHTPQVDVSASWVVSSPDTVGNFSAVAYHFARHLSQTLDVPVGLIDASWGGSTVEAWVRRDVLDGIPEAAPFLKAYDEMTGSGPNARSAVAPNSRPANLYNGMIHPIRPVTVRGTIWYQGESNAIAPRGNEYFPIFSALIHDWRKAFDNPHMPFLFVQLPNFANDEPNQRWRYPVVRQAQLDTLHAVPNTGMAITIDIGDTADIHPRNKHDVGHRLARWALVDVYEVLQLIKSGPIPLQAEFKDDASVHVRFDTYGSALKVRDSAMTIDHLELAGPDGTFHPASGHIEDHVLIVRADAVQSPTAVRYAVLNNPTNANLVNEHGLPASPFHFTRPSSEN